MQTMASLRVVGRWSSVVSVGIALVLSQGCGRSEALHPVASNSPAGSAQPLPFHPAAERAPSNEPSGSSTLPDSNAHTLPPFRNGPRVALPSGTLLTVQLDSSLSSRALHAGDTFPASVAAPLLVNGETVIAPGSQVTGRVESTQAGRNSGYFRLALSSIRIEGRDVPVETSSLFARGSVTGVLRSTSGNRPNSSEKVRLPKGRRLTFRLTAPITLDDQNRGLAPNAAGVPSQGTTR
jgi:hypothetical protein